MNKMKCFYVLNEKKEAFTQKPYTGEPDDNLLIGGNLKKKYANVLMGNFELYFIMFWSEAEKSYLLPDKIINLIQSDMVRKLDSSPSEWKKEQWISEKISIKAEIE